MNKMRLLLYIGVESLQLPMQDQCIRIAAYMCICDLTDKDALDLWADTSYLYKETCYNYSCIGKLRGHTKIL